jgi:endoglucanase
VAGYEAETSKVIKKYLEPLGDVLGDKLGSLICRKKSLVQEPKVMLAGHMDEIGFMVKLITKEGFLRFTPLGGWWDQVLRVRIKTNKGGVLGVIGAKPPHLLSDEERKKIAEKTDMYVDIGATSQQGVEDAGVRIGDPIVPVSEFAVLPGAKAYVGKAFDDRVGCALVITVLQQLMGKEHPNAVYGVATVQEEVGLRGATTSAEVINPDVAIILEIDIAGDVPGVKPEESATKLGGGPTLLAYDARMIPNLKLRDMVIDTARKLNLHRIGVPAVVVGVPTRHIHSHNAVIRRDDFDHAAALVTALVQGLDKDTVASLTSSTIG